MMEIERPKIETASLSPDGRYGKFVAEPLERGFGITLGNSLRRVLLSEYPKSTCETIRTCWQTRTTRRMNSPPFQPGTQSCSPKVRTLSLIHIFEPSDGSAAQAVHRLRAG